MPSKQTDAVLDSAKIKRLREGLGWSQQHAATAAGLTSRQRWHQLESGLQTNLELATLNAVAAALGVNAKSLLK